MLAVVAIFRQSTDAVRERRTVQRVYDFARRVELVTPDEAGTREIVEAVRELLNADRVALWLPPYLDEGPQLVVAAADGDLVWYDGPGDPDDLLRRRALSCGRRPGAGLRARADEAELAALGAARGLGGPRRPGDHRSGGAGLPGGLRPAQRRGHLRLG